MYYVRYIDKIVLAVVLILLLLGELVITSSS